jgi:hypothetical protein
MGHLLVQDVIEGTGLPDQVIRDEFTELLKKHGKTEADLTMDDLRDILAEYLQDVFVEMKNRSAC